VDILAWPSMQRIGRLEASIKEIRNVDFSKAHSDGILCIVDDSGKCTLWNVDEKARVLEISTPSDMPRGSFFRCISAVDDSGIVLYTPMRFKGKGYIIKWAQDKAGNIYLKAKSKNPIAPAPIGGFQLSHDGRFMAAVTPDGDQCIVSTQNLKTARYIKGAHMTFATAVTFVSDDSAIVSVSADASATLSPIPKDGRKSISLLLMCSLLVAIIAIVLHLLRHLGENDPNIIIQGVQYLPEWLQGVLSSVQNLNILP